MNRNRRRSPHSSRSRITTLGDLIAAAYDRLGQDVPAQRVAWLVSSTLAGGRSQRRSVRFG